MRNYSHAGKSGREAEHSEDEVDSPGIQLVMELDKLMSENEEPEMSQQHGATSGQLGDLTQEFSTCEKTGQAVDAELATILEGMINNKLPKAKLDELTERYHRPENCNFLLAPKANKTIWSQLKDSTKKADVGMQKCQTLFLKAAYAILQAAKVIAGEPKTNLIHALVLLMSGNREFNLKRRELLRPDLNSQFSVLCSASTPITTQLFGDDVGKEIDEVAKANRLSKRLAIPKRGRGSRYHPYSSQSRASGGFNNQRSRYGARGLTRHQPFLGEKSHDRRKLNFGMAQAKTPQLTKTQQVSYVSNINRLIGTSRPFKAGQLQMHLTEWKAITSDPFILQSITNCEIEFDYTPKPAGLSTLSTTYPECKFALQEQHAIDAEIDKFLAKEIIEVSVIEPGQIVSPIFLQPKKEYGAFRVIFNLKHLNQSVTYRKFKMDTLESAIKLMKPGCFMTSVDLQDAYYSIPVSPLFRKYLKFAWRGQLYQFRARQWA